LRTFETFSPEKKSLTADMSAIDRGDLVAPRKIPPGRLATELGLALATSARVAAAYYNYCRIHSTLRMTPAMKAGLVGRLWSIADLHSEISK
jgi:hypothetical protein